MLRHCTRLAPAKAGVLWVLSVGCLALTMLMSHAFVVQRAENVALAQATDRDGLDLTSSTRSSHQPPATSAGPLAVPGRTPASPFDIVSTMPSASCSPCATAQRRLDTLATEPSESSGLNVRLSQRTIHPPKSLVKAVVELPDVHAARARIAPSPKSAVLEDDNHNRALILSVLDDGRLQARVLADLDFAQHVPFVTACAEHRGCAYDRRPITGGLGCVAICIQQALDPGREP